MTAPLNFRQRRVRQGGQAMVLALLSLSLVLVGGLAFGVDATNLWFHRQAAQTAADAACTAGAMDLYEDQMNGTTTQGGFIAGTGFDCSSSGASAYAPCKYASFNGYSGAGLSSGAASNDVAVTFPAASVSGLGNCPASGTAACVSSSVANPFLQVNVTDQVKTYFAGLFQASTTVDVGAHALCGVVSVTSPLPVIVLHPTLKGSFTVSGAANLSILGGPVNSVQVDSDNATAAAFSGSGVVNLKTAGPYGTGGDFSVVGGPTKAPSGPAYLYLGTTGKYLQPAAAISDPFAALPAPAVPGYPSVPPNANCTNNANPCYVKYHVNGCPDTNGCMDYGPGLYDGTNGANNQVPIQATANISFSPYYVDTAIFDPGLYYIKNSGGDGISIGSASTVRPSTAGDGSGGTMFYLTGPATNCCGSLSVGGATHGVDAFVTAGSTNNPPLQCPGDAALSPAPPATISGNVLLGVCSGTYADPSGQSRGMLFFADHNNTSTASWAQPTLGGSAQLVFAGVFYFHSSSNSQLLTFSGASGSGSYAFSSVVVDQLLIDGSGALNMQLSPSGFGALKAALIQ